MAQTRPLVTLTTDFGVRDPYAAAVKGVIYSINPDLHVVDLTHEIPPQNVFEGALFLAGALPYFAPGAVHVAVVDPGVGTNRQPIVISAGDQYIVGPDNGLATLFLREHPMQQARIISNRKFMRESISATFHGRDIFAPAAAYLASGLRFEEVGEELDTIVTLPASHPKEEAGRILGEIMHVDRFGNLITNIHRSTLGERTPVLITTGHYCLKGVRQTYAEVPSGSALALFGSSGYLEIALNGASAHDALRLGRGDSVTIEVTSAD